MSDPSSAPPPPPSVAEAAVPARHEHLIELEAQRSWKRKCTVDFLKLSPVGMELHHGGVLREPLVMPLGAIATAIAEPGAARAMAVEGRFPILRRLSGTAVVPREEGVEGWLWTSLGGSAFPSLCEDDEDAPNAAIVFAGPLAHDIVTAASSPSSSRAWPPARRSALPRSTASSCASATSSAPRTASASSTSRTR